MRLTTPALAALAFALAAPAFASDASFGGARTCELDSRRPSLEQQRSELLLQVDLACSSLGERAAALLSERASRARLPADLELVANDALDALEALEDGLSQDAATLLLRSPSAVLARDADVPRMQGVRRGQSAWTRGSWMDSPDGVKK